MFPSLLIIAFSLILFVYWFRYSCILLLRNADLPDRAADTRFGFAEVRERLRNGEQLAPLERALDRDYRLLTYLLQHAAGLELETLGDRLLVLDYKVMQWQYRLTKTAFPDRARQALTEMATVVGILAQKIGEQAGIHGET